MTCQTRLAGLKFCSSTGTQNSHVHPLPSLDYLAPQACPGVMCITYMRPLIIYIYKINYNLIAIRNWYTHENMLSLWISHTCTCFMKTKLLLYCSEHRPLLLISNVSFSCAFCVMIISTLGLASILGCVLSFCSTYNKVTLRNSRIVSYKMDSQWALQWNKNVDGGGNST